MAGYAVVETRNSSQSMVYITQIINLKGLDKSTVPEEVEFYQQLIYIMVNLQDVDHNPGWNGAVLLHVIRKKLDSVSKICWRFLVNGVPGGVPTMDQLIDFAILHQQLACARLLEKPKRKGFCYYCKGEHSIHMCRPLFDLSVRDRWLVLDHLRLCVNCLKKSHTSEQCWNNHCAQCNRYHNTRLHFDESDLEMFAAREGGALARLHRANVARDHVNGEDFIPPAA